MQALKDQVFQATSQFIANIHQLAASHAAQTIQDTFASLSGSVPRAAKSSKGAGRKPGVAKRDPAALEQLSKRFVEFVGANPGLRIEQINKELGTSTGELALPIRKLIASGEIMVQGHRRATTYFPGEGGGETPQADGSEEKPKRSKSRRKKSSKSKSAAKD